jgi:hypothetical protein
MAISVRPMPWCSKAFESPENAQCVSQVKPTAKGMSSLREELEQAQRPGAFDHHPNQGQQDDYGEPEKDLFERMNGSLSACQNFVEFKWAKKPGLNTPW